MITGFRRDDTFVAKNYKNLVVINYIKLQKM